MNADERRYNGKFLTFIAGLLVGGLSWTAGNGIAKMGRVGAVPLKRLAQFGRFQTQVAGSELLSPVVVMTTDRNPAPEGEEETTKATSSSGPAILPALLSTPDARFSTNPIFIYHAVSKASWYSRADSGPTRADGKPMDDEAMTAASWFFPFGQRIRVTNLANGKSLEVSIQDRGPRDDLATRRGRLVDLTLEAFKKIADPRQGEITVEIEAVSDAVGD
jgi:rare lipoprotein A